MPTTSAFISYYAATDLFFSTVVIGSFHRHIDVFKRGLDSRNEPKPLHGLQLLNIWMMTFSEAASGRGGR